MFPQPQWTLKDPGDIRLSPGIACARGQPTAAATSIDDIARRAVGPSDAAGQLTTQPVGG